jgi:hypothetical protein
LLLHFHFTGSRRKLLRIKSINDRSSPAYKDMMDKNPLLKIQPPGLNDDYFTINEYLKAEKRAHPALEAIWGEVMEEQAQHEVTKSRAGKVIDKMSDSIGQSINETLRNYLPEESKIKVPVLGVFTISNGLYYISDEWMTEDQKARVIEFFDTFNYAWIQESIEQFRRNLPHVQVLILPEGHHYCFIKQEEIVYEEMRKFLLN